MKILIVWTIALVFLTREMTGNPTKPSYDFVIVGSGSAGSVIANRLSEIDDWNILLLEAGFPEDPILTQIPFAAPILTLTPYNWKYIAQYQDGLSAGLIDQRMLWPRGKALGGTTVINFMIYTRGNRLDYDRWAGTGNPGWSYDDVLPFFIKSENSHLENVDEAAHGHDGYLHVSNVYKSVLLDAFIEGGNELGLPSIDYNANQESLGVSRIHATVINGRRDSVAKAFLRPVRHRNNLDIVTSAFVTKVLINPDTKEAYGVEYERFGHTYTVNASKEVILSAGSFNSPQLLILAGIGPQEHLQELGIPLLVDLPVGQNLHDHMAFAGLNFLVDEPVSISLLTLLNPLNILNYFLFGKGPYTTLAGVEGLAYIKTDESQETEDLPDIEFIFVDACVSIDYGIFYRRWLNVKKDVFDAYWGPTEGKPCWTVAPMLLHPKSTGYLKLNSTDPHDPALFYGNYFTDQEDHDLKTMVAAVRYAQRLAGTDAFQEYKATLSDIALPGCDQLEFDSDEYWRCVIKSISSTLHHQVGTAKMGPANDPTTVVDHELKVHGIGKLRVSDCSVIPFALGAHTNAVSIMIGEKTSDIIKQNYGQPTTR